jgi:hypothetical protein
MCYYKKYYCSVCNQYSHTTIILRDCEEDCTSIMYYIGYLEEGECYQCDRGDVEE